MKENPRFWKFDTHFHTTYSDGVYSLVKMLNLARKAGLDVAAGTDHDRLNLLTERIKRIVYVPGIEITTAQGHVQGIFLDESKVKSFKPGESIVGMYLSFAETVNSLHALDAVVIVPHIGYGISPGSVAPETLKEFYANGGKVEGIEVLHPRFTQTHIKQAKQLADELKIAELGVSDDHLGNVGRQYITLVPNLTGNPKKDFASALLSRTTIAVEAEIDSLPISLLTGIGYHLSAPFCNFRSKVLNSPVFFKTFLTLRKNDIAKIVGGNVNGD